MGFQRFNRIEDVITLRNEATEFHARLMRMAPNDNGESKVDPKALGALCDAAVRLEVASKFNYSASGVVFLQKKAEILSGERPLKHIEAESAAGYIARQARKTCGF